MFIALAALQETNIVIVQICLANRRTRRRLASTRPSRCSGSRSIERCNNTTDCLVGDQAHTSD